MTRHHIFHHGILAKRDASLRLALTGYTLYGVSVDGKFCGFRLDHMVQVLTPLLKLAFQCQSQEVFLLSLVSAWTHPPKLIFVKGLTGSVGITAGHDDAGWTKRLKLNDTIVATANRIL